MFLMLIVRNRSQGSMLNKRGPSIELLPRAIKYTYSSFLLPIEKVDVY